MKTKIYIIIGLGILLVVLLSLSVFDIGSTRQVNLAEEEISAYNNREEITSLATPEAKASYAVGMSRMFYIPGYLDGKSTEFLALYYAIMSEPANIYYYMGQGSVPTGPEKISSMLTGVDIPLNAKAYVAGYAQTMEHKIRIPNLTGNEGMNYFNKVAARGIEPNSIETDSVAVEVVNED